jgi:hypothetical protein
LNREGREGGKAADVASRPAGVGSDSTLGYRQLGGETP